MIHQAINQNSSSTNGLEFAALSNARTGDNDNQQADNGIVNAAATITSWPAVGGGDFQWSVAENNVDKNAGSVTVPLVRFGGSSLPAKVSSLTYAATAGPTNSVASDRVVSLAAGVASTNITIPILNDGRISVKPRLGTSPGQIAT